MHLMTASYVAKAGPGGGTRRLHQNTFRRESFYGGELGSTGLEVTWSLPDDLVIDQLYKCKR